MAFMTLGSYTFIRDPKEIEDLIPVKSAAYQETYSDVAYFSWGTSIVGKVVPLEWDWMETTMFQELDTLNQADVAVVWNPQNGHTYTVEIMNLVGTYMGRLSDSASYGRKDVTLTLLIKAQLT